MQVHKLTRKDYSAFAGFALLGALILLGGCSRGDERKEPSTPPDTRQPAERRATGEFSVPGHEQYEDRLMSLGKVLRQKRAAVQDARAELEALEKNKLEGVRQEELQVVKSNVVQSAEYRALQEEVERSEAEAEDVRIKVYNLIQERKRKEKQACRKADLPKSP